MEIDELRARFECRRRLPIAPRVASRAVLRLRRDNPGARRRWTLGSHGSFEMHAETLEISIGRAPRANGNGSLIHFPGRLWDPAGTTMAGVDVEIVASGDEVDVALVPTQRLPEWFRDRDHGHWSDLARAALDELCEELLYYATCEDADTPRAS